MAEEGRSAVYIMRDSVKRFLRYLMVTIAVYSVVGIISLIIVTASEYPIIAILIAIIIPPLAFMILDD